MTQVIMEYGCLVVVQAVRDKTQMRSLFGGVVEDCCSLSQRLRKISLLLIMISHKLFRGTSYVYSCYSFNRSSILIEIQNYIAMELNV